MAQTDSKDAPATARAKAESQARYNEFRSGGGGGGCLPVLGAIIVGAIVGSCAGETLGRAQSEIRRNMGWLSSTPTPVPPTATPRIPTPNLTPVNAPSHTPTPASTRIPYGPYEPVPGRTGAPKPSSRRTEFEIVGSDGRRWLVVDQRELDLVELVENTASAVEASDTGRRARDYSTPATPTPADFGIEPSFGLGL